METEMATSKKDASLASKQLKSKGSTRDQKSIAGSDLSQTKPSKSSNKKKNK
jgi:hypothetical protein